MKIDVLATERQYIDHLAPVYRALPDESRGDFYTHPKAVDHAKAFGIRKPVVVSNDLIMRRRMRRELRLTMVASWGDMKRMKRTKRPLIHFEHGNGQTFDVRHTSYAGGPDRENVVLFVCPSERVAEANRAYYPDTPTVAVGCPKLDRFHAVSPYVTGNAKPVVALSFHWNAKWIPETRSAMDHYVSVFHDLAESDEFDVIGHGHPRILDRLRPLYRDAGIPVIPTFEQVLATADLYVNDCSSTLYEFASTGRPVVVLNAPWYRRDVQHGLRFWEYANVGVQVDEPDDLLAVIRMALIDPPTHQRNRKRAVAACYAYIDGHATERAVNAILEVSDERQGYPVHVA